MSGGGEMSKTSNGGNIFAADVYTHTRIQRERVPGQTRTHTLTGIRAHARPLVHIDTGCSECGSLGLALPQACGNSPEAYSAVRLLPHAKKTPFTDHNRRAILQSATTAGFRYALKNPYLPEWATAASVFCLLERCIEVVGARRTPGWGKKQEAYFILRRTVMRNRDSRAHYFASTVAA